MFMFILFLFLVLVVLFIISITFYEFIFAAAIRIFQELSQFWVDIVIVVVVIGGIPVTSSHLPLLQPQIQFRSKPVSIGTVRNVLGSRHFHDVLDLFGRGRSIRRSVTISIFTITAGAFLGGIGVGIVSDRLGPNVARFERIRSRHSVVVRHPHSSGSGGHDYI